MAAAKNVYAENGILISKASISAGDEVTVTYSGLLANCGADTVIMHIGYGETWENKGFIPMEYDNGIFKTSLVIENSGSLNIAFKDSVENWDNNSGNNYTFKVSKPKAVKAEKAPASKEKKPKAAKAPKSEKTAVKKPAAKSTKKKA